jgi:hypothetical protein
VEPLRSVKLQFWSFIFLALLFALIAFGDELNRFALSYKASADFLGALGTPIIALIAAYIASQQHITNRRQLQLARYERQKPVYTATYHYIHTVMLSSGKPIPTEIMVPFIQAIRESHFIFDGDEVSTYLGVLREKELELARLHRQHKKKSLSTQEWDRITKRIDDLDDWFQEQFADGARQVFKKHLKLQ